MTDGQSEFSEVNPPYPWTGGGYVVHRVNGRDVVRPVSTTHDHDYEPDPSFDEAGVVYLFLAGCFAMGVAIGVLLAVIAGRV